MKTLYLSLSALASALFFVACSDTDCSDNRNTLPLAGFLTSSSAPAPLPLSDLAIAPVGGPADTVLSVNNASEAYLPFDFESSSTSYVFRYHGVEPAYFDTITFHYRPDPWFASVECGVIYKYHMNRIQHTTHAIDSVSCPAGVIDNTPGQNIFIYFRPQSE